MGFNPLSQSQRFRAYRQHLLWANERVVEEFRLDAFVLASGTTVAWLIESGTVIVDLGTDTVKAGPGQWLFLRAADGRQHFSKGTRIISIRFDFTQQGGNPVFSRENDIIFPADRFPKLGATAMNLVRCFERNCNGNLFELDRGNIPLADNYTLEAAFYSWLSIYVRTMIELGEDPCTTVASDQRVADALLLIDRHNMQKKLSLDYLASRCGLSVNQLSRIFQQELGMTPMRYYENRRKRLAVQALQETRMQIKEIAFELGFSSSPHFTNWFKRNFGQSPHDFREEG